jgi:hypothetical protein
MGSSESLVQQKTIEQLESGRRTTMVLPPIPLIHRHRLNATLCCTSLCGVQPAHVQQSLPPQVPSATCICTTGLMTCACLWQWRSIDHLSLIYPAHPVNALDFISVAAFPLFSCLPSLILISVIAHFPISLSPYTLMLASALPLSYCIISTVPIPYIACITTRHTLIQHVYNIFEV